MATLHLSTDRMKIITWNCQGAFRKKAEFILTHLPDVLIIPESEHSVNLKFKADVPLPTDSIWLGNNPNKGLGVFSYSDFRFKLLDLHNPDFKNVLAIAVTGGKIDLCFLLFGQIIRKTLMEFTLRKFGKLFITMTVCLKTSQQY